MIYFSDLDRTMICSKKLVGWDPKHICIEYIDDRDISYISKESLDNLRKVTGSKIFIPTTTRNKEEFDRIDFKKFGVEFEYAITSNGACIWKNGKKLKSWENEVLKMKEKCMNIDDLVYKYNNSFHENISLYIDKFRVVEDNFFYIVLKEDMSEINFLDDFISYLKKNGWTFFKNSKKIYFLPEGMTKENAIKFLMKTEFKSKNICALGDSSMDIGMLEIANKALVPRHGNIASYFNHNDLYITKTTGLDAVNEMLEVILTH